MGDAVRELFADYSEVALFYFAGHGYIGNAGGFLCASNTQKDDDDLSITEVLPMANASKAKKVVVSR